MGGEDQALAKAEGLVAAKVDAAAPVGVVADVAWGPSAEGLAGAGAEGPVAADRGQAAVASGASACKHPLS